MESATGGPRFGAALPFAIAELPAAAAHTDAYARNLDADARSTVIVMTAMAPSIVSVALTLDTPAVRAALTPATTGLVANRTHLFQAAVMEWYRLAKRRRACAACE
jgi:hypothetical protein